MHSMIALLGSREAWKAVAWKLQAMRVDAGMQLYVCKYVSETNNGDTNNRNTIASGGHLPT